MMNSIDNTVSELIEYCARRQVCRNHDSAQSGQTWLLVTKSSFFKRLEKLGIEWSARIEDEYTVYVRLDEHKWNQGSKGINARIRYQYQDWRFFYDPSVASWTLYKVNDKDEQIGDAEYFHNKSLLLKCYPEFSSVFKNPK